MKAKLCPACNGSGLELDAPLELWSYPLFKHMAETHGLTLLESEMEEIIAVVEKLNRPKKKTKK